jgi:peroxiredoxin
MRTLLFIAALCLYISSCQAQNTATDTANRKLSPTYILPNGTIIPKDKIDSVDKSWNGAAMIMQGEKDKGNNVFRLIRLSESEMKQLTEHNAKANSAVKAMINKAAPDFELVDLTGRKWSLSSLKGKVVVLNFWYTSCPPCVEEMPALNELITRYPADKVVFLALTFDDAQKVGTFLKHHEFNYHLLPSSKTVDEHYQISGWPTSLVIDKNSVIKSATGSSSDIKKDLSTVIDPIL